MSTFSHGLRDTTISLWINEFVSQQITYRSLIRVFILVHNEPITKPAETAK